jgi:fumarate hydratase class II
MLVTALNTQNWLQIGRNCSTAHKNGTTLKEEAVRLGMLLQKI